MARPSLDRFDRAEQRGQVQAFAKTPDRAHATIVRHEVLQADRTPLGRVPSHRQTRKESHPVVGFYAMKTGKTLLKPAGDRNIFCLSGGRESLPRLRKARPDFSPSFHRDEPDRCSSLRGFTPDQHGKLLEKRVFGQFGNLRKNSASCGKAT